MGFLEKLQQSGGGDGRTKIDKILNDESNPKDFRAELLVALMTPSFSAELITKELRGMGFDVGATTVKNYRRDLKNLFATEANDDKP